MIILIQSSITRSYIQYIISLVSQECGLSDDCETDLVALLRPRQCHTHNADHIWQLSFNNKAEFYSVIIITRLLLAPPASPTQ